MKKRIIGLTVVLLIAVIYLWPTPKKEVVELFDSSDKTLINGLTQFRKLPTKTIQTQGHDWTYLTLGTGPKTILFLHGMTGAYDFWWQQMNQFSREYRVVSVTYPPIDNLNALGKGVIAILNKEGIRSAAVVGSSLGGYLTQYLLAIYPQRVDKAVLGNTFPENTLYEERNHTQVAVANWLPEWVVMNALRNNLTKQVIPASESNPLAKAQLLENTYGRMSKAQFLARYQCVIDKFQPIDGKQTKTPLLILESDNDPLILPELRAELKAYYTTAQVHTFRQKGHFPYLNACDEYNAVLGKFLTN